MSTAVVAQAWSRIEAWLGEHAALTLATLNGPADPAAIAEAERVLGFGLPADLAASLARHDGAGQDQSTPARFELAGGYGLMALAEIVREWRMFTDLLEESDDEWMTGSWWHQQWVPVGEQNAPDRLIIDQRPGKPQGQVGEFYHEGEAELGRWESFGAVLAYTADLLEGRATDDQAVPRIASGRLVWGWADKPRAANPRSVLALADAAYAADEASKADPPVDAPADPADLANAGGSQLSVEPIPGLRPYRPAINRLIIAMEPQVVRPAGWRPPPEPTDGPDWIVGRGLCCLTFAHGITEAELISRLGGDPARAVARTADQAAVFEASWRSGYRPLVLAGRCGDWAFGFETGHREGTREEAMRRLSAGARAVSVAFDGIITQLSYAEDGVVAGLFDSREMLRTDELADPDWLRRLEQAGLLPRDPERYVEDEAVMATALAVSLGPATFDPRVLREPLRSAPLLPLLDDPPTEPRRWPVQSDPEVVAAIEYAAEDQLRPAVTALARHQVVESGLGAYPEIVAAVNGAADRPTGQILDDSPLGVLLRTLHAEWHAAYEAFQDHQDPAAADLLTESERAAWGQRSHLASVIEALVARPAAVAAYLLAGSPETFSRRQEFLDDLSQVSVPPDATERLERAEQQERDNSPHVPWVPPKSRLHPL